MSIDEIINGQKINTPAASDTSAQTNGTTSAPSSTASTSEPFPGLLPLIESYLDSLNIDIETRCELARYLELIRMRASGSLCTGARWIRHFVRQHKEYNGDSVVSQGVAYDLCRAVEGMSRGERGKDGMKVGYEMVWNLGDK